jgi:hypothetical protein
MKKKIFIFNNFILAKVLNVIHILKVAKQTPCERPGAC